MLFDPKNPYDRCRADTYYKKLMSGTEPFEMTLKRKRRTLPQNALFHVWCQVIADFVGYTSLDECKYDIKKNLLGLRERVDHLTGEIVKDEYHTSEMTVQELSSFMDRMKAWAATDLGIYLPYWKDPGYEEMIEMYKNR